MEKAYFTELIGNLDSMMKIFPFASTEIYAIKVILITALQMAGIF